MYAWMTCASFCAQRRNCAEWELDQCQQQGWWPTDRLTSTGPSHSGPQQMTDPGTHAACDVFDSLQLPSENDTHSILTSPSMHTAYNTAPAPAAAAPVTSVSIDCNTDYWSMTDNTVHVYCTRRDRGAIGSGKAETCKILDLNKTR